LLYLLLRTPSLPALGFCCAAAAAYAALRCGAWADDSAPALRCGYRHRAAAITCCPSAFCYAAAALLFARLFLQATVSLHCWFVRTSAHVLPRLIGGGGMYSADDAVL